VIARFTVRQAGAVITKKRKPKPCLAIAQAVSVFNAYDKAMFYLTLTTNNKKNLLNFLTLSSNIAKSTFGVRY